MAFKKPAAQEYTQLQSKVDQHEKDIKEQRDLTKFFIIVVAATLVATLVGLGGVYISAISQSDKYEVDTKEMARVKSDLEDTKDQLNELKINVEIVKFKYPWLKDYGF